MPRRIAQLVIAVVLVHASVADANLRLSEFMNVLGSVRSASRPVGEALVVAFNLADYRTEKARTSQDGSFTFPPLRAGIYRIIAIKDGFAPAVATVVPNKRNQTVELRLERGRTLTELERDQIWQIRRSLPSDVLRELNIALASPDPAEAPSRFEGEMASLATVADGTNGVAQTAFGVRGALGEGLRVDLHGQLDRMAEQSGPGFADGSDVMMTIESGQARSYGVLSRRNSWSLSEADAPRAVDLQSHQIELRNNRDRLRFRYFTQENLFAGRANTELFEMVGEKRIYDSASNGIGVRIRLEQESALARDTTDPIHRAADISASGSHRVGRGVELGYVLHTRVGGDGRTEYAPESSARLRFGGNSAVLVSGLYKIGAEEVTAYPRAVVFGSDDVTPRYRYTVGIEQGMESAQRFVALFTIEEVDAQIRVVFDDRFGQVWDGFYLDAGDVRRDLSIAYRTHFGDHIIFDFVTNAGDARNASGLGASKSYVSGKVQSHIRPSGTTLDIGYRYIDQPLEERLALGSETSRLNIRMAQSLHLPLDLRVLVGIDLARSDDDSGIGPEPEIQKRLLGGISFAF